MKEKKDNEAGRSAKVLIPVDFTPNQSISITVGFELASRIGCEVTLLHASALVSPMIMPQFPDDFNGMDNENAEIEEMEFGEEVHYIDEAAMRRLERKIGKLQDEGKLRSVSFNTLISPGMPEEVIKEYCALSPPKVIVMATRGNAKRREDLVGSVTAEVIDHCIAPVLTVPEDYPFKGFEDIVRICAFCGFDEGDYTSIATLMEMFGRPQVKIYLFPVAEKAKGETPAEALEELQKRLAAEYPEAEFICAPDKGGKNVREEAEALFEKESIQMILAPNRKRSALARIFNPGLPHKILYEIDFPMLAIPIY